MNTSYGLDAYRSHDLNIMMRTSSGDTIEMDFSNKQSLSMSQQQDRSGTQSSLSFSSMQSFNFSINSNGLDEQDKKEIASFMEQAQPFIDSFLQELQEDAPKSPVSKLAQDIASTFEPSRPRDENTQNNVKSNIVKMFDQSLQKLEIPQKSDQENRLEKIFEQTQKLLEKTLQAFDTFGQNLYA